MRATHVALCTCLALLAACRLPAPLVPAPRHSDHDYLRALRLMVPVEGATRGQLENNYDAQRGAAAHAALDILAPAGTPVLAAVDGRILRVSSNALGGRTIYQTDRGGRFVFYYAHLHRYAARTRPGAQVLQGDIIGYVGTTGNAPRRVPHLHFQVMRMVDGNQWWEGPPVNPYPYFARSGRPR